MYDCDWKIPMPRSVTHSAHQHVVIGPNKDINKAVGKTAVRLNTIVVPLRQRSIVVVYSPKREKRVGERKSDEKRKVMIDQRVQNCTVPACG
jgi:hypothetical protein